MTVPALLLPALLKTALDFDVDVVAILKNHGIDPHTISLEKDKIPADRFNDVVEQLALQSQSPALGIAYAHHFSFDYLSEMETFLLSVGTLREAMLAYRWMAALFDSIVAIRFESDDRLFTTKLQFISGTPYWVARLFAECSFSLVSRLALQRSGNDLRIDQLNFAHEDKGAIPVYRNLFRCAVNVGQNNYSISFTLADIDRPLGQASPALKALSQFQIEQRLKRLSGEKTLEQSVHDLLMQHPFLMEKGIDECASRLYLSPRTLQRQLQEAGTSYRTIRDNVRRALAKDLLQGSSPLEKISDLLCFSDRRSFTRAFQKWEGMTPKAYRNSRS